MNLVACRYNPNHKMKQTRLLIHEEQCPDKKGKNLKMCPYNPIHKVTVENYERHKQSCDQRPKVDAALEMELKEYLKNLHKESQSSTMITKAQIRQDNIDDSIVEKENENINEIASDISMIGEIKPKELPTRYKPRAPESNTIGLRQAANEKKDKKERKLKQRQMMNLIENSEFEESGLLDGPFLDEAYDDEFININNVKEENHRNFDKQSVNTLFTYNTNLALGIGGNANPMTNAYHINDDTQLLQMIDNISEKNDYDPNQSDLFITKNNKHSVKPKQHPQRSDLSFSVAESFICPDDN
jgi:hypothetical protein